jgi:hypothetical protein
MQRFFNAHAHQSAVPRTSNFSIIVGEMQFFGGGNSLLSSFDLITMITMLARAPLSAFVSDCVCARA